MIVLAKLAKKPWHHIRINVSFKAYNIVGWQRAKTAKHKILISASISADTEKTDYHSMNDFPNSVL